MQVTFSAEINGGLGKFGDNLHANHWNHLNLQKFTFYIDLAASWLEG